jgi:hypothetical protein
LSPIVDSNEAGSPSARPAALTGKTAEKQVVSRQRVADHGEVLTGAREVNAMLDLVKQETERIDSRFLEPACGDGNFLAEILQRKLRVVEARYRQSQLEYERNAVLAVSSLYGIDILADNVVACRKRLLEIFAFAYSRLFKKQTKPDCCAVVQYILERNIIHGDALTLKTVGANPQPIVFTEWSFPFHNSLIKRREFSFSDLLPDDRTTTGAEDLFAAPTEYSDLGTISFIPKELKTYPPTHFLKLVASP